MADVLVKQFTYQTDSKTGSDRISRLYIKVYGDGAFIREVTEITETQSDAAALSRTKNSIEKYGITAVDGTRYILETNAPPTPPAAPTETNTGTNTAVLNDAAGTLLTGTSEPNPDTEWSDRTSSSRTIKVTATKNGKNYTVGFYNFYNKDTDETQKEIWARSYEDIASRIFNDDVDLDPTLEDKFPYGYTAKVTSYTFTPVPPDRIKEQPAPPPPPPPPPPVIKDRRRKRERYVPESRYGKPKSTSGGDFVIKETGEDYKGNYIEIFDGRFLSGTKPEENGAELVELSPNYLEDLMPAATVAAGLLAGFFKPKLKKGDKERGKTKRFFVQDKRTNKITETNLETYQLSQNIPSKRFVVVDWELKGPAEDQVIKGYPYEGAASKNKKAIAAVEKQMPGISTYITDYAFLVEEPSYATASTLSSDIVKVQDPLVVLENSRKANFDTRK
jgi:hypothetical protein